MVFLKARAKARLFFDGSFLGYISLYLLLEKDRLGVENNYWSENMNFQFYNYEIKQFKITPIKKCSFFPALHHSINKNIMQSAIYSNESPQNK